MMSNVYWYCTRRPDDVSVNDILATVTQYAGDLLSAVQRNAGSVVYAVARLADEQKVSSIVASLEEDEHIVLVRAASKRLGEGLSYQSIADALSATGEHSVLSQVLGVEPDGTCWAVSGAVFPVIVQAIQDQVKSKAVLEAAATSEPAMEATTRQEECYVVLESDRLDGVREVPDEWAAAFVERIRTAKNATSFNFTGRCTLSLDKGCLVATLYFESLSCCHNFAEALRVQPLWKFKLTKSQMVTFNWSSTNPVVGCSKIDTIEDIVQGVADGKASGNSRQIRGSVAMIVGPTQAGKSTSIACIAGRKMILQEGKSGCRVVEGLNPLIANAAALQSRYVIVKRNFATAAPLPQHLVADRLKDPDLAGLALSAAFDIVAKNALAAVLETGNFTEVHDEDWITVPDLLAVAKEDMGRSTTAEISAYAINSDTVGVVLDTPGTHDTHGLRVDVQNTVARQEVVRECDDVRYAIVVDYRQLTCAGGQKLPEFLAPAACTLRDYEGSLPDCSLLFTHCVTTLSLREGTNEEHTADLIKWTRSVIVYVDNLRNGPVGQDKYVRPLLLHATKELQVTLRRLETGRGPWGKATVVHPLLSPQYLIDVLAAATPLTADSFQARLGPHASLGLGRCLDARFRLIKDAMVSNRERDAFALTASMYRAMAKLTEENVLFTDDARFDVIENDLVALFSQARAAQIATLEAAVVAGDGSAASKAVAALQSTDKALSSVLEVENENVRDLMLTSLKLHRDDAARVSRQVAESALPQSVQAQNFESMLSAGITAKTEEQVFGLDLAKAASIALLALCRISRACCDGGSVFVKSAANSLQALFTQAAELVGGWPASVKLRVDAVVLRKILFSLAVAKVGMNAAAAMLDIEELTVAWVTNVVDTALSNVLAGLKSVQDFICESGKSLVQQYHIEPKNKKNGADLLAAAKALKRVGQDAEICKSMEPVLRAQGHTVTLLQFLCDPLKEQLSEHTKEPLREVSCTDPVHVATHCLRQLAAKLEATKIFATDEDDIAKVVADAGRDLGRISQEAAECFKTSFNELATLNLDASCCIEVFYDDEHNLSSHQASATVDAASSRHTSISIVLHTFVALASLSQLLVSAGHPEKLVTAAKTAFTSKLSALGDKVKAQKSSAINKLRGDDSATELVKAHHLVEYLMRCRPINAVFDSSAAAGDLRSKHEDWLKRLSCVAKDLCDQMRRHVETLMELKDSPLEPPYRDWAKWLRQLADLREVRENDVRELAVQKQRDIVAKVDERHRRLVEATEANATLCAQGGKTPPFNALFTDLFGECLRMKQHGVLEACNATGMPNLGSLIDLTSRIDGFVDSLCHYTRNKITDAAIKMTRHAAMLAQRNIQWLGEAGPSIASKLKQCVEEVSTELHQRHSRFTVSLEQAGCMTESSIVRQLEAFGEDCEDDLRRVMEDVLDEKVKCALSQIRSVLRGNAKDCPDALEALKRAAAIAGVMDREQPDRPTRTQLERDVQKLLDETIIVFVNAVDQQQDWSLACLCASRIRTIDDLSLPVELVTTLTPEQDLHQRSPSAYLTFKLSAAVDAALAKLRAANGTEERKNAVSEVRDFVAALDEHTDMKRFKSQLNRALEDQIVSWSLSEESNQQTMATNKKNAEFLQKLVNELNRDGGPQPNGLLFEVWPAKANDVVEAWAQDLRKNAEKQPLKCVSSFRQLQKAEVAFRLASNPNAEGIKKHFEAVICAIETAARAIPALDAKNAPSLKAALPRLSHLRELWNTAPDFSHLVSGVIEDACRKFTEINSLHDAALTDFINDDVTEMVLSDERVDQLRSAIGWISATQYDSELCGVVFDCSLQDQVAKLDQVTEKLHEAVGSNVNPEALQKVVNEMGASLTHGSRAAELKRRVSTAVQEKRQRDARNAAGRAAFTKLQNDALTMQDEDWDDMIAIEQSIPRGGGKDWRDVLSRAKTGLTGAITAACVTRNYNGVKPLLLNLGLRSAASWLCADFRDASFESLRSHLNEKSCFSGLNPEQVSDCVNQLRCLANEVGQLPELKAVVESAVVLGAEWQRESVQAMLSKDLLHLTDNDFLLIEAASACAAVLNPRQISFWDAATKRRDLESAVIGEITLQMRERGVAGYTTVACRCAEGSVALDVVGNHFSEFVSSTLTTPGAATYITLIQIDEVLSVATNGSAQEQAVVHRVPQVTRQGVSTEAQRLLENRANEFRNTMSQIAKPVTHGNLRTVLELGHGLQYISPNLRGQYQSLIKDYVESAVQDCERLRDDFVRVLQEPRGAAFDGDVAEVFVALRMLDNCSESITRFNSTYQVDLPTQTNNVSSLRDEIKEFETRTVRSIRSLDLYGAKEEIKHVVRVGGKLNRAPYELYREVQSTGKVIEANVTKKLREAIAAIAVLSSSANCAADELNSKLNVVKEVLNELAEAFPAPRGPHIANPFSDVESVLVTNTSAKIDKVLRTNDDERILQQFIDSQNFALSVPLLSSALTKAIDEKLCRYLQAKTPEEKLALFTRCQHRHAEAIMALPSFQAEASRQRTAEMDGITPQSAIESKMVFKFVSDPSRVKLLERVIFAQGKDGIGKRLDRAYVKKTDEGFTASKRLLLDSVTKHKAAALQSKANDDVLKLLIDVAFTYSWLRSGETYNGKREDLIKPHAIQLAAIMRLLNLDAVEKTSTMVSKLPECSKLSAKELFPGHVLQILTGQGKSIVLAITACVLALLGRHVDVVCYSQPLTDRDERDFKQFFDFLGVSHQIAYLTFQGVMERRVRGVRECMLDLVGVPQPAGTVPADTCDQRRVLLIDEVDIFFSKQFFGQTYTAAARYATQPISALLQHVYDVKDDDLALAAVMRHQLVTDACASAPDMANFIRQQVNLMTKQVKDFGKATTSYDPNRPHDYVVDMSRGIGYYDSDGTINFRVAPRGEWYKPAFALLKERASGTLTDDIEARLSLPLPVPPLSYAHLPTECYCAVFGVTGTLTHLPSVFREELKTLCNVVNETEALSIHPVRADVWTSGNTIMIPPGVDEKSEWLRAIHATLAEVKTSFGEGTFNLPAVVVFESASDIRDFLRTFPELKTECQIIDRNTDPAEIDQLIACATTNSKITLVDSSFGRGTDFKCRMCYCLTIIQTFLPETLCEEVQIHGRTGRQGQRGRIRIILRPSQVAAVVKGSTEESVVQSVVDDFRKTETTSQHIFLKQRQERENARARELLASRPTLTEKAAEFIAQIFNPTNSASAKADLVLSTCGVSNKVVPRPAAFFFILDASVSMKGENWDSLKTATRKALDRLKATQPDAFVVIVTFGCNGSSTEFAHGRASCIASDCMETATPDKGTEYFDAFDATVKSAIAHTDEIVFRANNVLFMTDGADGPIDGRPVGDAVNRLFDRLPIVTSFWYVLFGRSIKVSTNPSLSAIEARVKARGVTPQARSAENVSELTAAFVGIVDNSSAY